MCRTHYQAEMDCMPTTQESASPRACSPCYVVKTIFRDSSVLAFTQTGFNAMFGHQFAKPYHHQHGICAEVIHHLRLHETHQGS